jgi:hypothetical protein
MHKKLVFTRFITLGFKKIIINFFEKKCQNELTIRAPSILCGQIWPGWVSMIILYNNNNHDHIGSKNIRCSIDFGTV